MNISTSPPFCASSQFEKFCSPSHDGDWLLMFPLDFKESKVAGLRERFSVGSYIPFSLENGVLKTRGDYGVENLYNSLMRVKDIVLKRYGDLDKQESQMIQRSSPGFLDRQKQNKIKIQPQQIVTLIRVNPQEALCFGQGKVELSMPKYQH